MRMVWKIVAGVAAVLVAVVIGLAAWLAIAPPDLIRVGGNYAAKIVCSNVFIAGRDPQEILRLDVQAPGHPLLRLMRLHVDREAGTVSAGLFGLFGRGYALHRPGLGCTSVPSGDFASFPRSPYPVQTATAPAAPWPEGNEPVAAKNARLEAVLDDAALTGPGMRAVVVVKDGRIVGERYGDGFGAETPLLGWSMTKTVNAALIGIAAGQGLLSLDQQNLFGAWRGDDRREIRLVDLMGMSSGLAFNEDYGSVTDVTRMLFLEPDMAGFAVTSPLESPAGSTFRYSSGTAVLLSRLWQDAAADRAMFLPQQALFGPLGMTSAVLEVDRSGTFVGSSYLYATARDWARFGQLLLQDGEWRGRQILPAGFAAWMREEAPASGGTYGRGQLWLEGPDGGRDGADRDRAAGLPDDTFWLLGHDGQSMAVIPSERAIVLRLGLTPWSARYATQRLVRAALDAVE
jgi:CubicO group peptidase (beta-lactamase class C family)